MFNWNIHYKLWFSIVMLVITSGSIPSQLAHVTSAQDSVLRLREGANLQLPQLMQGLAQQQSFGLADGQWNESGFRMRRSWLQPLFPRTIEVHASWLLIRSPYIPVEWLVSDPSPFVLVVMNPIEYRQDIVIIPSFVLPCWSRTPKYQHKMARCTPRVFSLIAINLTHSWPSISETQFSLPKNVSIE